MTHKSWTSWWPLAVLPIVAFAAVPSSWPRWALMWSVSFAIYCGCKWLVWRQSPVPEAPLWKHLGFLLAWPGLDASAFLRSASNPASLKPSSGEWLFALGKGLLGIWLLFGFARRLPQDSPYLVGWAGMIGIVMTLHFGLFHLLSCGWRTIGVDARPLMNWPLLAESVSDFWSRRWNTAFRDLTHRFLFRPIAKRWRWLGPRGAIVAGFVFSGWIHDVVISIPAGGGYGGPTAFFLIQGAAIFLERSRFGRRVGLGSGWRGWLFTLSVLVLPVGLLLHRPFVVLVIVPFMNALGALP